MRQLSIWTKIFLGLVAFSLAGTLLSAQTAIDPGPIKPVSSMLTLAFGFVALARSIHWGYSIAILIIGAGAEVCGILTCYPYGRYEYTARWWPIIELPGDHLFPLLVPLAWFLVAGGCALTLKPVGKASLILAPTIATLIDFLMEPVMVHVLGYWRWLEPGPLPGGAPWMNVAGWFATSFAAAWIVSKAKPKGGEDSAWVLIGFISLLAGIWLIATGLPT